MKASHVHSNKVKHVIYIGGSKTVVHTIVLAHQAVGRGSIRPDGTDAMFTKMPAVSQQPGDVKVSVRLPAVNKHLTHRPDSAEALIVFLLRVYLIFSTAELWPAPVNKNNPRAGAGWNPKTQQENQTGNSSPSSGHDRNQCEDEASGEGKPSGWV